MELMMASQNAHKIAEIQQRVEGIRISGLDPTRFPHELREDGEHLEDNALQKARQVHQVTGGNCFADDTGLEVEALDGAPGVRSARYAGPDKDSNANMDLLLSALEGKDDRRARFRTVIALIWNGEEHIFEGVCEGVIASERKGQQGFGYDPIFIPEGQDRSFAQMDTDAKNRISHRGKAVDALVRFLEAGGG